jgi:hypothetical protein
MKVTRSPISTNLSTCKRDTVMVQLTEDEIKKEMTEAFEAINLSVFDDILRIKKPSLQAMTAGQMVCKLVTSFRGGSSKINLDTMFLSWREIQDFISKR